MLPYAFTNTVTVSTNNGLHLWNKFVCIKIKEKLRKHSLLESSESAQIISGLNNLSLGQFGAKIQEPPANLKFLREKDWCPSRLYGAHITRKLTKRMMKEEITKV